MRTSRRRFLEAAATVAAAGFLPRPSMALAAGQHVRTLPFLDEGPFPLDVAVGAGLGRRRALDLSMLTAETLVTPTERFFIRTACPDRLPSSRSWKIRVHGLVAAPIEIDAAQLRRQAVDQGVHVLECAGNARAAHFGFMSAARWRGVSLSRALDRVRTRTGATQVLISGFDEHTVLDPGSTPGASWIFDLDRIRSSGAFLATGMNDGPLTPDHGAPVRLVVPGWYGCTAIKWVNEIVLVDDAAPATDQMREFAGRTHQNPVGPRDRELMAAGRRPEGPSLAREFEPAVIDAAALPIRVEARSAESAYRVVGILWGGARAVRGLGIRFTRAQAPVPVEHVDEPGGSQWCLWTHTFHPPGPGRYRIELAVSDPGARTRRLDAGHYAREFEVPPA